MKYLSFITVLLYAISEVQNVSGYRILGLFPFSGKSHYIFQQSIFLELVKRGHEVTVVTSYEENNPPPNYTQIVVDRKMIWEYENDGDAKLEWNDFSFAQIMAFAWKGIYFTTEAAFNSTSLQKFIKEDKSHFDLIFIEYFYQPVLHMFAYKYKAPVVILSTSGYIFDVARIFGSPVYLSYMSHDLRRFKTPLSLFDKLLNVYSSVYDTYGTKNILYPMHQKLAEKHFNHLPQPLPKVEELMSNISLVFLNTHYSVDTVRPSVPGVIEIGGAHIKKPQPLPADLQKYLDDAKDGFILFSLGSNMKSNDMSREKIEIFLKVFGRLKQKVLWKFEDDNLVGKPKNVRTEAWLTQNDILAHKNIKAFITHGGLLSTQEAIYHGVPVIGIPFYGDQYMNTKKMELAGFGIQVIYDQITEELFENSLKKIMFDPKYQEKASVLSRAFKDRPLSAIDTVIYWMEYIIRHKGAPFMRSPLADMSFVEANMLDLIGIIAISIALFLLIMRMLLKKILGAIVTKKMKIL